MGSAGRAGTDYAPAYARAKAGDAGFAGSGKFAAGLIQLDPVRDA
jgi:hypothetical protein